MQKLETKVTETEAATDALAAENVRASCTGGWGIGKQEVLQTVMDSAVRAFAPTEEGAAQAARSKLPQNATPAAPTVTQKEETVTRTSVADSREGAEQDIASSLEEGEEIVELREAVCPRKGFFGLGRRPGRYEASIRRLPGVSIPFTRPAKLRTTLVRYPSLAESLREVSEMAVPREWKAFSSDQLLFRLRYPSSWKLNASHQISLIPIFADRATNSPWLELMAMQNDDKVKSTLKDHAAVVAGSEDFALISEEKTRLHGCEASCVRYTYTDGGAAQACFALLIAAKDFAFSLVAQGETEQMMKRRDDLEKVLGLFRPYNSKSDYAKENR